MATLTKSQIRPILDTRYGNIIADGWARDPRLVVLVFGHEYVVAGQQQNLLLQIERILDDVPDARVLAEGSAGPRDVPRSGWFGNAIKDRERRQSAALERLAAKGKLVTEVLSELHPTARIEGVDDPQALVAQRAALKRMDDAVQGAIRSASWASGTLETMSLIRGIEGAFDRVIAPFETALNPRLRKLIAFQKEFHTEFRLAAYSNALAELARAERIDLQGYLGISALADALELERRLDFTAVERERMALVEEIASRSSLPLDAARTRRVDEWMAAAPIPDGVVLSARENLPGVPPWFTRLIALSRAYADRKMSIAQYNVCLSGLLDALGIPLDESTALGRYVHYVSVAEQLNVNDMLVEELPGLHAGLADVYTTSATERGILQLLDRLGDLYRYIQLQMPEPRVRTVGAQNPSFAKWLDEAVRLGDAVLTSGWLEDRVRTIVRRSADVVDKAMPSVSEFYAAAQKRSETMIRRALEGSGGVAVLVCGRFHLHEAQRALGSATNVSWAIMMPRMQRQETIEEKPKLQVWHWAVPDREPSLAETADT